MTELEDLALQLKVEADKDPLTYDQIMDAIRAGAPPEKNIPGRWVTIDGVRIKIQFSRVNMQQKHAYLVSLGNETGDVQQIPESVIIQALNVFMVNPIPIPSILGNSIQFLQIMKEDNR